MAAEPIPIPASALADNELELLGVGVLIGEGVGDAEGEAVVERMLSMVFEIVLLEKNDDELPLAFEVLELAVEDGIENEEVVELSTKLRLTSAVD